jgi:hypothetical protein
VNIAGPGTQTALGVVDEGMEAVQLSSSGEIGLARVAKVLAFRIDTR